jgi:two-component system cell cycle sensor histidine kinase/response regulator CckA
MIDAPLVSVLIVDDNEEDRFRLRRYLEYGGYHVLEASGSKEGLAIARDLGTRIDLLIADLRMPKLNGFELAQRLKSYRPDLKTAFVSGYSMEILTLLKMPIDKDWLVHKSLDRDAFLSFINRFLSLSGLSSGPLSGSAVGL